MQQEKPQLRGAISEGKRSNRWPTWIISDSPARQSDLANRLHNDGLA